MLQPAMRTAAPVHAPPPLLRLHRRKGKGPTANYSPTHTQRWTGNTITTAGNNNNARLQPPARRLPHAHLRLLRPLQPADEVTHSHLAGGGGVDGVKLGAGVLAWGRAGGAICGLALRR